MKVKCFFVSADSKNRDIAPLVEKRVNDELAGINPTTFPRVDVQPDLSSVYGKALVTISYDDPEVSVGAVADPVIPPTPAEPKSVHAKDSKNTPESKDPKPVPGGK